MGVLPLSEESGHTRQGEEDGLVGAHYLSPAMCHVPLGRMISHNPSKKQEADMFPTLLTRKLKQRKANSRSSYE